MRFGSRLLSIAAGVALAWPATAAERYALLIGVEKYQDSDRITTLNAADDDAEGLAKTLVSVAGFKRQNVMVLTSANRNKPTRRNILFEVGQLVSKSKADDMVLITFSGHGMQLDDATYLIPFDGDLRNDTTLRSSSIGAKELQNLLKSIKARVVILSFDMCRNRPSIDGGRSAEARNTLGKRQARDLVLVADPAGVGPKSVVTLFSCSPLERSWEWRDKKRGFFSYFFEKGIGGEAADENGEVKVVNLVSYLQASVPGAVAREVGEDQNPLPETSGEDAMSLVLSKGLKPGKGGTTVVINADPQDPEDQKPETIEFKNAFQRGMDLMRQKRYDAAIERFMEAARANPGSAAPHAQMGLAFYKIRRLPEAERALQTAAGIEPKNAKIWNNLGLVFQDAKKPKDAEDAFKKSMEFDPQLPAPVANLARFLLEVRRDLQGAEQMFRKATALDPNDPVIINNLGAVLRNKGDLDGAEAQFTRATKVDPEFYEPVFNLANIKFMKKQDAEADKLYKQASDLRPNDALPYNMRGKIAINRADYPGALAFCRRAVELDPNDGEFRADYGLALFRTGRRDEAGQQAAKARELGFSGPHPLFSLIPPSLGPTETVPGRRQETVPPSA